MKRIAKFHKVSKERFVADWMDAFEGVPADEAEKIYEGIRLPRRATAGSAGYDFFSPADYHQARRDHQDSDRDPCGDGPGMGAEMLSKKRSRIQIPSAAE